MTRLPMAGFVAALALGASLAFAGGSTSSSNDQKVRTGATTAISPDEKPTATTSGSGSSGTEAPQSGSSVPADANRANDDDTSSSSLGGGSPPPAAGARADEPDKKKD